MKNQSSLPRVLVLLASYNGASWIQEQIQSILMQISVDVRIVVRDDRSSDDTPNIVRRMASTDSRIDLYIAPTASGSASQNFFSLIRECSAEGFDYIALSDQDDIWDHNKLSLSISSITETQASGSSSAVTAAWPSGITSILRQNPSTTSSDYLFEGAGQGCTFMLIPSLYSRIRIFLTENEVLARQIHFHDWTIYALSRSWGLSWVFQPQPTMTYRQHSQNDTGARTSLRGIFMRIVKIRRGWYKEQLLGISKICLQSAETNATIAAWYRILNRPRSAVRQLQIIWFCILGGRRRTSDNIILIVSALAGWI